MADPAGQHFLTGFAAGHPPAAVDREDPPRADHSAADHGPAGHPSRLGLLWLVPFAALALFVAWRMGLGHLSAVVATPDGPVAIPNGFAGVDHPFHTVRAETLRRSLAAGEPLRWIGHHQGGYPVEFYPLGAAWLAVAVWAVSLGTAPMEAAYAASVWVALLLPGVAWAVAARRDRLPLGAAFLALAIHVAVPGAWWHGGYTELVQWGLVTNVLASAWVLFALVWLAAFLETGRRPLGSLAMLAAAAALFTNPRSAIALAAVGLGVLASRWLGDRLARHGGGSSRVGGWPPLLRLAGVGLGTALLAAPELVALARFAGLYEFVHYSGYESTGAWWASTVEAVSAPVLAAAVVGVAAAWVGPDRPVSRAASLALPLYAALTLLAAANPESGLLAQLEATRLMPFQRLLTIWLGAVGVAAVVSTIGNGFRRVGLSGGWKAPSLAAPPGGRAGEGAAMGARRGALGPDLALLLLAVAVVAWWVRPGPSDFPVPGPAEAPERGLYPVARSGVPAQAAFQDAVVAADRAAPPGTALLAVGSALSWHQQLWAPLWTDRPLFYDNWLWFWHPDHAGPPGYAWRQGHHYPRPELALDPAYLRHHGIGAAVVTGRVEPVAAAASALAPISTTGDPGVWEVVDPTALISTGGRDAVAVAYGNGHLGGTLSADGDVTIRHNWHPRWGATLDGRAAAVERAPDGTMRIAGGRAGARLELGYEVDRWDWAARAMTAAGVVGIALWVAAGLGRGPGRSGILRQTGASSRRSRRGEDRSVEPARD